MGESDFIGRDKHTSMESSELLESKITYCAWKYDLPSVALLVWSWLSIIICIKEVILMGS